VRTAQHRIGSLPRCLGSLGKRPNMNKKKFVLKIFKIESTTETTLQNLMSKKQAKTKDFVITT
jgi:hypothetical protein